MIRAPSVRLTIILAAVGWLALPASANATPQRINAHAVKIGRNANAYDKPTCRTTYTFGRHGTRKVVVCDGPARPHSVPQRRDHNGYGHRRPSPPSQYLFRHSAAPWHTRTTGRPHTTLTAPRQCQVRLLSGRLPGSNSRIGVPPARIVSGAPARFGTGEHFERACLTNALEHAPDYHTATWQAATGPARPEQVTPYATRQAEDGRYCREFTGNATIRGQQQSVYGRACRQPDGTWKIIY